MPFHGSPGWGDGGLIPSLQLDYLRNRHPHRAILHMSILTPEVILNARVNGNFDRGGMTILYDGGSGTGAQFDRITPGMPLWVGTAPIDGLNGRTLGKDRGVVRVRSITGNEVSGTIELAENNVVWQDNYYLAILEDHPLFPIHPYIDDDLNFFKDYDIAYVDQNEVPSPVAVIGPHRAAMLGGDSVRFYLDARDSYAIANGAAITGYLWECAGGVIGNPTASTTYIDFNTAGQYWLSCTVTDGNGKSQITYRAIFVHDDSYPPRRFPEVSSFTGSWESQGWNITIPVHGNADLINLPDEALVVVWYESYYDGSEYYIGGWIKGNSDCRHVLFNGYLVRDSTQDAWDKGLVELEFNTVHRLMSDTPMMSFALTDHASPTVWHEYYLLTVARALHHLWKWHSTLFEIVDVYLPTANTRRIYAVDDFVRGDLLSQAEVFAYQHGIFAHICCNKQGQVIVEEDINILGDAERDLVPIRMTIRNDDWRGQDGVMLVRELPGEVHSVTASGTAYDGAIVTPYISIAPGRCPANRGARDGVVQQQILADQAQLNELSGRVFAIMNAELRDIRIPFCAGYVFPDVVPQMWYLLSEADDSKRGFPLSLFRHVPREVTLEVEVSNQMIMSEVAFAQEPEGIDGVTEPVPEPSDDWYDPDPPTWPIDPDPPPPPELPTGLGTVYVTTETHIGRTRDFDAIGGASWSDITGAVTGTIVDFILDPWDPRNRAYVYTWNAVSSNTSGLWRTSDLDAVAPTWTLIQSAAALEGGSGYLLRRSSVKIMGSPNYEGYIAIIAEMSDSGDVNRPSIHCWRSYDHGSNVSRAMVYRMQVSWGHLLKWWGCADIVPHSVNGNIMLWTAAPYLTGQQAGFRAHYSPDGGASWVNTGEWVQSTWSSAVIGAYSMHCPYNNNESGQRIVAVVSYDPGAQGHRVRRRNPAGTWSTITPTPNDFRDPLFHRHAAESHTYNYERLFAIDDRGASLRMHISDDNGASWTTSGANPGGVAAYAAGGFPYNNQLFYLLTSSGIFYSLDRGDSWNNALGDWVTAVGAWDEPRIVVPMWLE